MFGNKLRFKRVEIDGLSEELAGTEIAGATASLIVTVGGHHEPRLIVIPSDIKMPGMAGWNCLGGIKQHFPDFPVMRSRWLTAGWHPRPS